MTRTAMTLLALVLLGGCRSPDSVVRGAVDSAGTAARNRASYSESEIEIEKLPTTVEEFLALRDQLATEPRGGAAIYVVAQLLYTRDQALGLPCLTIALERQFLVDAPDGYRGMRPNARIMQNLRERVLAKPYIARSYIQGTSHEDGYALPQPPYVIATKIQRGDPEGKVFVYSTGADTPRPITLVANDSGIWKAHEWSSLEVGVRAPVEKVHDDF